MHAWLVAPDGRRVSSLDLVEHGSFTVLTGLTGTSWVDAAATVSDELKVPVRVVVVDRDAYGRPLPHRLTGSPYTFPLTPGVARWRPRDPSTIP